MKEVAGRRGKGIGRGRVVKRMCEEEVRRMR